jgi:hypothetical protein
MREDLMEKVGIYRTTYIQTAIMANHKPNEKGVYPDWADTKITFSNIEKSKLSICSKYTAMPPFTGFKTGTP